MCDLRIRASAGTGSRGTVISELHGTEPWRPRILAPVDRSGFARVALVQTRASLITGDDVGIEVLVGPGAALELVELGALLAMDARGGVRARLRVNVEVGAEGRLIWLGQPLIAANGSLVESRVDVSLACGAVLLRGESVVLGRSGEVPEVLSSRTRIVCDGRPLLDETLRTGDRGILGSAVVAGSATTIAAVTLAGMRDEEAGPGAMQADGPATLWRGAGPTVETTAEADRFAQRWRGLMTPPGNPPTQDGARDSLVVNGVI